MSSAKSGSGHSFRMSDGDWICEDQNCQNINFARRVNCNLCGKDKPIDSRLKDKESADKKRKLGHEIGKAAADKSKGLFAADDWQCGRCGNVNWARRSTCNMCSAPKFGDNEERTGLGGGYNEREEHIEYIEREDSDDEWDDFGRKKKRRRDNPRDDRSRDSSSNESKHKSQDSNPKDRDDSSNHKSDDESHEEEDDDEEEGDVSKYKLESDEEEEEEDGGGEDLSKYDLSDCLEDKK